MSVSLELLKMFHSVDRRFVLDGSAARCRSILCKGPIRQIFEPVFTDEKSYA